MSTQIFLDTEFTGLHQKTTLISIGLVAENGNGFYAEFNDYDVTQLNDFISQHVLVHLNKTVMPYTRWTGKEKNIFVTGTTQQIKSLLEIWLTQFSMIEIWADALAYDWVLFCELFGGAMSIPKNIFYAPFDLATLFRIKGFIEPVENYSKDISRFAFVDADESFRHNALEDAKVELLCYLKLVGNE